VTRRNLSLAVARGFSVPTPKVPIAGPSTTLCVMPSHRITPPRFTQTTGAGGRENLHKLRRQHRIAPDDWAICTGVLPRGAHANSLGLHKLHGQPDDTMTRITEQESRRVGSTQGQHKSKPVADRKCGSKRYQLTATNPAYRGAQLTKSMQPYVPPRANSSPTVPASHADASAPGTPLMHPTNHEAPQKVR